MSARRQKALGLLQRLKTHQMEESARALGALQARISTWEGQQQHLRQGLEQGHLAKGGAVDLSGYLRIFTPAARLEIDRLGAEITGLTPQLEALQEKIRDDFRQRKTYEILQENLKAQMHQARKKQAQDLSDELVLGRWKHAP